MDGPDATRLGAACMALPVAYLFMLLTTGPLLAGYNTSLRHFLPVMIGVMPAALVLCGLFERTGPRPRLSLATVTAAGLAAILAVAFASDFWARARLLARTGTMLAYVRNWPSEGTSALLTASSEMLQPRGPLAHQLAELQQKVPAGEPLLVWSTAPFLLDFARNPIIDVDIGGVANPWSKTPPVSYVLWQRSGFGVRLPADYERQMRHAGRRETYLAARGLAYFQHLEHLASRAKVLVDDGSTVVLRIE